MTGTTARTPLDRFLWLCLSEIERRAGLAHDHRSILGEGARAFRAALAAATGLDRAATTVPVTRYLDQLRSSPLVDAAVLANNEMPWVASPRLDDDGATVALAVLDEVRDLAPIVCGMMLVAPGAAYPEHSHPPNEIYLPIAGHDSKWRHRGSATYQALAPDALVYNHPNAIHGTVAGTKPVLALYVLWP